MRSVKLDIKTRESREFAYITSVEEELISREGFDMIKDLVMEVASSEQSLMVKSH